MENHPKNQALAEEIAFVLEEPKNIGLFYKLASTESHQFLRDVLSWVRDYPNPLSKGKLFFWRLKQLRVNDEAPVDSSVADDNLEKLKQVKAKLNFDFNK